MKFSQYIRNNGYDIQSIETAIQYCNGKSWQDWLEKYREFLTSLDPDDLPEKYFPYDKGNSKLPFWKYSALPQFTCPSADACLNYCYSFKAWRYPAAFFKQVINTKLLQTDKGKLFLAKSFHKIADGKSFDFRLYVDGDIDSISTAKFWFDLLRKYPTIRAYGYSKSFGIFLQLYNSGYKVPDNYILNISNGSVFDGSPVMQKILALPFVRERFVALPLPLKGNKAKAKFGVFGKRTKEYASTLREIAKSKGMNKVFVCLDDCGKCGKRHACGNPQIDIPIVIGVH